MTYDIRKTDGTRVVVLDNEIIDTETISGIGLIGRLTPNYGETQSNNFVHILENFASRSFPENPLVGQLCYKKSANGDGSLYVCVNNIISDIDSRWKKLPLVLISNGEPSGTFISGDMWYDESEHCFKIYDSKLSRWLSVGPDNFNNITKVSDVTELENGEQNFAEYDFNNDLDSKTTSYLITAKVVAKEVPAGGTEIMTNSLTCGWVIKLLVNCYAESTSSMICKIIDEPDYELIGTNATGWSVRPEINDTKLSFKVSGTATSGNVIKWAIQTEMLKVS